MERDVALRLDGMLAGVRGFLDTTAYHMKENLSADEYKSFIIYIGAAMTETIEFSSRLYAEFPDITPKYLK